MGFFKSLFKSKSIKKPSKREIVDKREAKCPYCGKDLDKVPGAKTKCPHCEKYMHVRTNYFKKNRKVVTEKEKEDIDFVNQIVKHSLPGLDIEEEDIKDLIERGKASGFRDGIWSMCNQKIFDYKKKGEFRKLRPIYLLMERVLKYEGKDTVRTAKLRLQAEAMRWRKNGCETVIPIVSMKGGEDQLCEVCEKWDGKEIDVDKAISEKPIPPEGCKCEKDRHWNY